MDLFLYILQATVLAAALSVAAVFLFIELPWRIKMHLKYRAFCKRMDALLEENESWHHQK